ncbi:sensor domain-containing diguanylate cyclase [Frankia sp. R43]|uniref:diguanylate cyclase domain-containing protein n=1 Tax=Frankia sp. R43 TaxID=269536 RepID=UPI001F1B9B53|nr:sensor domain-containing diguanylate cyclase [Frankia sp. R43]
MDWSDTALGPVRGWSRSLCAAVSICLESRFPLEILWGPDLIEIHNDAVVPMIGRKHPGCIGRPFREIFPEAADRLLPMLEQVMSGGGATWAKNWPSKLHRYGYLEDCYFTFSYSPIRRLPDGDVEGVLATLQETTDQVLATRRLECLHKLAGATSGLYTYTREKVFTRAVDVLSRFTSDIPYCLVVLGAPGSRPALGVTASTGVAALPGTPCTLGSGAGPQTEPSALQDSIAAVRPQIVDGLLRCLALTQVGDEPPPSTAAMVVPLSVGGDPDAAGLVILGISDRLPVNTEYRTFLSLVANQIAGAARSAQAAERERIEAAHARHRALHDALTDLPNRTALFEQLEHALAEAGSGRGHAGFLFVDLDGFKRINDTLGHQAGDDLLCKVAERLRRSVRPGDMVARLSGDEFGVLCRNVTSSGAVEAIADRIVRSLDLTMGRRRISVTASVGIAMTGAGIADAEQLVRAADTAMYTAKRQGRGRWQHAAARA